MMNYGEEIAVKLHDVTFLEVCVDKNTKPIWTLGILLVHLKVQIWTLQIQTWTLYTKNTQSTVEVHTNTITYGRKSLYFIPIQWL